MTEPFVLHENVSIFDFLTSFDFSIHTVTIDVKLS